MIDKEINLSEEQHNVLNYIKDFILDKNEIACVLEGSGGTGKSFLLQFILKFLKDKNIKYCLCAPTHKAALVMQQYSGIESITLHSLLAMSPVLDILQLDFADLQFNCGNCKNMPFKGIVICDEASMINDNLYDFIIEKCKEFKSKVLFIGDKLQLSPVKSEYISKVWDLNKRAKLTKIYRQKEESALTPLLANLRESHLTFFNSQEKEKGSIFVYDDITKFKDEFVKEFDIAVKKSDILRTKILAYTNARVNIYNKIVHKFIFGQEKEYYKHEFITCYENVEYNYTKYYNSMDYIIINDPRKISINIPGIGALPGYELELYDSLNKSSDIVNILSKDIDLVYFNLLAEKIEEARVNAVQCKNKQKRSLLWKTYFSLIGSFASPIDLYYENRLIRKKTFDYGYAITVHKSQGSSIYNTFIDMKDILKQTKDEDLRQLQYVAISRTIKNTHIYV